MNLRSFTVKLFIKKHSQKTKNYNKIHKIYYSKLGNKVQKNANMKKRS